MTNNIHEINVNNKEELKGHFYQVLCTGMDNPLDLKLLMNQTTNTISSVSSSSSQKTYKCDTCNATYNDKLYYDLHKQSHQKDMTGIQKEYPLVQIVMNPGTQIIPQPTPAHQHQGTTQIVIQEDQLAAYKRAYGVEAQQVYTLAPVTQYQVITSNNRSGTAFTQSLQNQVISNYSTPTYVVSATPDGHQLHAIQESIIQHEQHQQQEHHQQQQEQHHHHQQEQHHHQQQEQHHQQQDHQQMVQQQQQQQHQQHQLQQQQHLQQQLQQQQSHNAATSTNTIRIGRSVVTQKDRPFKCDLCTATFIESSELEEHKKKHTGDGPFTCEDCHFTFMYKSHFRSHKTRCQKKRALMPNPPKPIVNPSPVKRQFPTNQNNVSQKKQQQQTHQPNTNIQFQHFSLSPHITNVVGSNATSRISSNNRQGTNKTSANKFNPNNPSFKRIKKESRLDRPYECDECDASFQNDIDLKNHKSKHTGEGPFKCEECRFVFLYRKLYDAHRRRCEKKRKDYSIPVSIAISSNELVPSDSPSSVAAPSPCASPSVTSVSSAVGTIMHPQQVQHLQQGQEIHLQAQSLNNGTPTSLSAVLAGSLQMHTVAGQPTIIEMRPAMSQGQEVQQLQVPHQAILEQVIVAPGTPVSGIGGGRHEIKYEMIPANSIEMPDGVHVNQIMNLIKVKGPNQ